MKDYSSYDFYAILGIERNSDFLRIKKAYYQRAKDCHPDLHGGSEKKTEEFKTLVLAFNVLSDPDQRYYYDFRHFSTREVVRDLPSFMPSEFSVMDSPEDDTLEELIVGNNIPEYTTLATLFLDLVKTEVFMNFREGKYLYRQKQYRSALDFFNKTVSIAPTNILYRYYLARTYASLGKFSAATREYSEGIKLGDGRIPPQKLDRFHAELAFVGKKRNPLIRCIRSFFKIKKDNNIFFDSQGEMISEMNRAISKINDERRKKTEKNTPLIE